jgi:O-antigen/teichoic acid export membrane protein
LRLQIKEQVSLRSGSLWVLAAKVVGAGAAYVLAAVISRQAGIAAYGTFELAVTLVWIAAMLGRLGLDGAWVRHLPEARQAGGIRGVAPVQSVALVLAVSTALGVGMTFSGPLLGQTFSSPHLSIALRWAWLAVPGLAVSGLAAEMLRGAERLSAYAWLQRGTLLLATLMLFAFGLPEFQSFAFVTVAASIVALVLAFRAIPASAEGLDLSMRQLLRTAGPMLLTAATFELMSWTDTLLCGYYLDEAAVGRYRLAFRFAALLTLGQTAINAALAPKLARTHSSGDTAGLIGMLSRVSRWNWAIALSGAVFLLLAGPGLLEWFGAEEASPTLRILLIGAAFNAVSGPVLTLMNMTGAERRARDIVAVSAVLNLGLNVLWIPRFGIVGAAWATTLSTVLWNGWAMVWVWRERRIWTWFPKTGTETGTGTGGELRSRTETEDELP